MVYNTQFFSCDLSAFDVFSNNKLLFQWFAIMILQKMHLGSTDSVDK